MEFSEMSLRLYSALTARRYFTFPAFFPFTRHLRALFKLLESNLTTGEGVRIHFALNVDNVSCDRAVL